MIIGKQRAEKLFELFCIETRVRGTCPICKIDWRNLTKNEKIEHITYHKEAERKANNMFLRSDYNGR